MKIEFNRQQRTLLFFILPCFSVIIILAGYLIFSDTTKNSSSRTEQKIENINTSLPNTKSNLQDEKINVYKNEEYRQKMSNTHESDFVLENYTVLTEKEAEEKKVNTQEPLNPSELIVEEQTGKRRGGLHETRKKLTDEKRRLEDFDENEVYDEEKIIKKNKKANSLERKELSQSFPVEKKQKSVSFNSISLENSHKENSGKSGILAFIHGNQTVYSGGVVKIRLGQETILSNGSKIPANSFLYATCSLKGERLILKITQAQVENNIFSCSYAGYGSDGNLGIYIPGSIQRDENKKNSGKGMRKIGSALASGINIAGGGILGDIAESATEGVIDAVADGSSKAVEQTKIYLPNNERIFLK